MNTIHYSFDTLLLYVAIAFMAAFFIYLSKTGHKYIKRTSKNFPLLLFFLLLTVFASIRMVSFGGLGGKDSYTYELLFKYSFSGSSRFINQDILFGYFNKLIRTFTDNVYIYRTICYAIIVYGYVAFIKYVCPENVSALPFITLMIPYLKSFNTMRTSIAISVFLIGLTLLYRKKDLKAAVLILSTMFIHRISVIFVIFLPFYYIVGKRLNRKNTYKIIISSVVLTAICIGCAFFLRDYILVAEILDSHDMYYLNRSKSGTFSNIIMLIPTFLLIVVWFVKANSIIGNRGDKMRFLEILIAFDCIIIPVAAVFGIWRANEYLYLPRLSLWGVIVFSIAQKFARNSRSLIYLLFFIGFSTWLVYRILREWEPNGLMPYIVA